MTTINNLKLPSLMYGTAWKRERTKELVKIAINAGFRAIDTANQKKHYREDFVGEALAELPMKSGDGTEGGVAREALFLQSKFTYVSSQDHRLPYDPSADYPTQVRSSFESTLKNLGVSYLDAYLLHGPEWGGPKLSAADWAVWRTMEELHDANRVRAIGISNVSLEQLAELYTGARVRPQFVQNRCYAARGWDIQVREFCSARGIVYQGFSLLTANPHVVQSAAVKAIASRLNATNEQVIFRFAMDIGIWPLTGTTDSGHMIEDLAAPDLQLSPADRSAIKAVSSQRG